MIAMIFEVWPNAGNKADYLDEATKLRSLLDEIDRFISIERFESLYESGKILSLGFFQDEKAVAQWQNLPEHRRAQMLGRNKFFTDYRLRIAEVVRDYSKNYRDQAPGDSKCAHITR